MSTHHDQFSYSEPLKLRLVEYFRKHYDLDVKDEEVDLFLSALAALYDELSRTTAGDVDTAGEAGVSTDLISPHS